MPLADLDRHRRTERLCARIDLEYVNMADLS